MSTPRPTTTADKSAVLLPPQAFVEFIEAFHRLFKIGTYYPAGHAVLDRAVQLFQHHLQKIAQGNKTAGIEIKGATIKVGDQAIPGKSPALIEMARLFNDLGISRLEIDRAVPLKDLLQLVATLLQHRSQLQGIKQFTKATILGLPSTIRINQQEFLVDQSAIIAEKGVDDDNQSLDSVFQALEEQGLDPEQIGRCRKFLQGLSRRFAAQPIKLPGLPAVGWHDVHKLLIKAMSSGFQFNASASGDGSHNDLNALSAIFDGLKEEIDDRESRETINLLVSIFDRGHLAGRPKPSTDKEIRKGLRAKDRNTDMTIGEIQALVGKAPTDKEALPALQSEDRRHELSILLQLLQFPQEVEAADGIRRGLRDILANALSPRMVDILNKGLTSLAHSAPKDQLQDAVSFIAGQLRSSETFSSLSFLVLLCRSLTPELITTLWTTLVGELLAVGRPLEQRRLFAELVRLTTSVPQEVMRDQSLQLEDLDVFKEKKIAGDIFDPEITSAYPLYGVLLETSLRTTIAVRILATLRANPPDWFIGTLAPLLDPAQPQHLHFLYAYLNVAQSQRFPLSLQILAGKMVVERLPLIEETARDEPWVARTIEATPRLQVEGTRELLEKILAEKRLMVVPKWPSACRKAATLALQQLKRKPLG